MTFVAPTSQLQFPKIADSWEILGAKPMTWNQEVSTVLTLTLSKIMKKTFRCYRALHLKISRKATYRRSLVRLGRRKKLTDFAKVEDKSFLLQRQGSTQSTGLPHLYNLYEVEDKVDGKTKGKKKVAKDIQVIWANNPKTNAVFTKLGATDIVVRYDGLLSEWKFLKDAEKEFKQVLGLDQDKDLVQCIDSIPPDMRIGFSHGSNSESEYEFHLDIDPLVSLEKLNAPLTLNLKRAVYLFTVISQQMNTIQVTGAMIIKDLERLVSLFKLNEPFVEINGVQHSVELLNSQQVEQAYLIIKDIVSLTGRRSQAMMDYILEQGDKVDLQVIKDDPDNHKVIIFSKKLSNSKKRKS